MQESAIELTKVSRLLLAVDNGEVNRFVGKNIGEIDIKDLPGLEDDEKETDDNEVKENESDRQIVKEPDDRIQEKKDYVFKKTKGISTSSKVFSKLIFYTFAKNH
ncbi:uncharacterized protein [Leptinotarsa decemlineata]|uniref:uncharacterized protein n=1 Tax=Leptinotarsa decemlineata TaxID=7539 RepID=UPI003D30C943